MFYIVKHIEKGVFCRHKEACSAGRAAHAASGGGYASEFRDRGIQTYYVGTRDAKAQLTISTSGKASCTGTAKPEASTSKVSITVKLRQKKDDGAWALIGRWTDSGSGKDGVEIRETMPVERGYSYQVVMTGTVRDAAGKVLDNISEKSSVRRY